MKQFTVPQFIDVEDKIIGPITTRQFIIIIVAGIVLFLEYKLSDIALFILIGIPTILLFGIFAFVKVNGVPFHFFALNIITTLKKPALRVWRRQIVLPKNLSELKKNKDQEAEESVKVRVRPPVTKSRLSDLSIIVDTGGVYSGNSSIKDLNS
jgi:hypothetical protein